MLHYVVLAAGNASRMGFDKVIEPLAGSSPLERIASALDGRPFTIVLPSRLEETVGEAIPAAAIAVNDEPERGMAHSLRVALAQIDPSGNVGVLLGDMPAMTTATIARTEAALTGEIDVAYPVSAHGRRGHPVLFSSRLRARLEALPDGDLLRLVRDDTTLKRATWVCEDGSAFLDVDDKKAWESFGPGQFN